MHFLADIHGEFGTYQSMISGMDESIQLGDFGLGFPKQRGLPSMPPQHRFLRGNHDHPQVCQRHPNYLGEYGYLEEQDLFFVSGAQSVDQEYRTIGLTWWPDEELSTKQLTEAIDLFGATKPRVVASHDCPLDIYALLDTTKVQRSRTATALNEMLLCHTPELWVFGHHHVSRTLDCGGTRFICVGLEGQSVELITL